MKNIFKKLKKYKNEFKLWRQKYRKRRRLQKYGKKVIFSVKEVLDSLGIEYWLEAGTLLGAVREKGFIKHDVDIDISIKLSDFTPKIREELRKKGLILVTEYMIDDGKYGREENYRYKKRLQIDFFYNTIDTENKKSKYHIFYRSSDLKEDERYVWEYTFPFTGIKNINFLGKEFKVPENYDDYLKALYGRNYMIPMDNWTMEDDKNYIVLKDKIGKYINHR